MPSAAYSANDPKQSGKSTILNSAKFFKLLVGQRSKLRISPYDCIEGDVWDDLGQYRHRLMKMVGGDGSSSWHSHGASQLAL